MGLADVKCDMSRPGVAIRTFGQPSLKAAASAAIDRRAAASPTHKFMPGQRLAKTSNTWTANSLVGRTMRAPRDPLRELQSKCPLSLDI